MRKLLIRVEGRPGRQPVLDPVVVSRHDKIHSKGAGESGVFGAEDATAVVGGDIVAFYGGPEGLEVAVEEEGVELAGWGDTFAEGEEGGGGLGWVLRGEVKGRRVGVESCCRVAQEALDSHHDLCPWCEELFEVETLRLVS